MTTTTATTTTPGTAIAHDLDLDACARRSQTTGLLRRLADVLDADEPHTPMHIYLGLSEGQVTAAEPARVAVIDALAAALGLTAAPTRTDTGFWHHEAATTAGEVHMKVHTHVTAPATRCGACGVVCTHGPAGAR